MSKRVSAEREKLLREELDRSEATRDEPLPPGLGQRRGRSEPYSIRLSADAVERLEDLARKTDMPASALARGFVLAGLAEAEEPDTVQALLQRVESDLAKLRRVVGTE